MSAVSAIEVVVSTDRLQALVRLGPHVRSDSVSRDDLRAALVTAGVVLTPEVEARLDELVALLQSQAPAPEEYLVADNPPPGEPIDARLEWAEALKGRQRGQPACDGSVNHYDRNGVVGVQADEVIGRIVPSRPGRPAVDVRGQTLAAREPVEITVGANVELAEDGQTVRAGRAGHIVFQDDTLSVEEVFEVRQDVDFGTGNIDTGGDVVVRGSVMDLFRVRSGKNIEVDGFVYTAFLEAAGDILVRGGVHGHGKARLQAGGRIETKICGDAIFEVGGDFVFQRQCTNCCVRADRVVAPAGILMGGYCHARNTIEVQDIGSDAHVRVLVSVGVSAATVARIARMASDARERREGADKIRESLAPLVREMRRLSPEHRERVTELMFQADRAETEARQLDEQQEELARDTAPQVEPAVIVGGSLHRGVTIAISGRMTTLDSEIRGPVRIVARKTDGVTVLVATDTNSGNATVLPTRRLAADAEERLIEAVTLATREVAVA